MSDKTRFGTTLSFIDFAFNLIIALVALFLLSIIMLNPPKQENSTPKDAKYLVIMRWQDGSNHDVDLWMSVRDKTVGFPVRQAENLSLERDDLGPDDTTNMIHYLPLNEEIISIRAFLAGTYTVAAHWYRKRDEGQAPIVHWAIVAVHENNRVIHSGQVFFGKEGQEITLVRFTMDSKGQLSNWDTSTQYPFVLSYRDNR